MISDKFPTFVSKFNGLSQLTKHLLRPVPFPLRPVRALLPVLISSLLISFNTSFNWPSVLQPPSIPSHLANQSLHHSSQSDL